MLSRIFFCPSICIDTIYIIYIIYMFWGVSTAEVSFISHEAVCAALAMNGRSIPRRGGPPGGPRGDRHRGGAPQILRIQLPPPDSLDACFSKFRSGGLGGPPTAAPPPPAAAPEGPRRGGPPSSAGVGGGSPLSRGGSGGGPHGGPRGSGGDKWRRRGKSPEAAAAGGSSREHQPQQQQQQQQETSGPSNGSSASAVPLVAPKDLLKEQLKPQG